jgi:cell division protein FtsQ
MGQWRIKQMKKIVNICIWIVLGTGLIFTLAFVNKTEAVMPCKSLDITIADDPENFFVQPEDIKMLIREKGDSIVNQPVSTINVSRLENILNNNASISKAQIYITINGEVKVEVKQRRPLVRIIDKYNDSYYIDEEGRFMPLSDKFTSKVLVANGNFRDPYNIHYIYTIKQIEADSCLREATIVDDIFELAKYINADEVWRAQIVQIYVNSEKEIELVPRIGDQRIILGDISDMDQKFKKLLIFYKQGLNPTGWWNAYSVINLKFRNQVVCTKKEINKN